jgi:hypothetical protein
MKKLIFSAFLIFSSSHSPGFTSAQNQKDLNAALQLQAQPNFQILPTGEKLFSWTGQPGGTYFIEASPDLLDWTWAPNIEPGVAGPMSYEVDGPLAKGFFRLTRTDQTAADPDTADFDGDGLTNFYEITPRPRPGGNRGFANLRPYIQTNPLRKDSDGDGLNDKWEEDHGLDSTDNGSRDVNNGPNGDADGDGVNNRAEEADDSDPNNAADFPVQLITISKSCHGNSNSSSDGELPYGRIYWGAEWYHDYHEDLSSSMVATPTNLSAKIDYIVFPALPPDPILQGSGSRKETLGNEFEALNIIYYWKSPTPNQSPGSPASISYNGSITAKRVWLKAPVSTYEQKFKFLRQKIESTFDYYQWIRNYKIISTEEVSLVVPAGQTYTAPLDLQPIPAILDTYSSETRLSDYFSRYQIVSRDRYLAGSFHVSGICQNVSAEFINTTTGENLGTFSDLQNYDSSTRIFSDVTKVLDPEASESQRQPVGQRVWFVHDSRGHLNFYTCFSQVGEIEIRLKADGEDLVTLHHTLTYNQEFSGVIDYVNDWVKGTSFSFAGGSGPLALAASPPSGGSALRNSRALAPTQIDYLTSACLIPFFNVINQVEGLSAVVIGLCDGLRNGFDDDWEFCKLIGRGFAAAGDFAFQAANAELQKWATDPFKRALELHHLTSQFVEDVVFKKLKAVKQKLSTWEGFKEAAWASWAVMEEVQVMEWTVAKNLGSAIVDGLTEWGEDYLRRMETGAEKANWIGKHFVKDKILGDFHAELNHDIRTAGYTFGYTFGYITEQVVVGALTAETGNLAKAAVKGGIELGSKLSLRTAFGVAARGQLLDRWLGEGAITVEAKILAERGLAEAANTPISAEVKQIPAEEIEKAMRMAGYDRNSFGLEQLIKESMKSPAIQKLLLTEAGQKAYLKNMGLMAHVMGDKLDATVAREFIKVMDTKLISVEAGGIVTEWSEDFLRCMRGNAAEMAAHTPVTVYEDWQKNVLESLMKDKDIWKSPPIGATTRGVIIETILAHTEYKGWSWTANGEAVDFFKDGVAVQLKTIASESSESAMRATIRQLSAFEGASTITTRVLDIRVPPGVDAEGLASRLEAYVRDAFTNREIDREIEIRVSPYKF